MEKVVKYNTGDKLENYIDKVTDQRREAITRLIRNPSAENAGKVRELNGQLTGMLAIMNLLDSQVKSSAKMHMQFCREIIRKTL